MKVFIEQEAAKIIDKLNTATEWLLCSLIINSVIKKKPIMKDSSKNLKEVCPKTSEPRVICMCSSMSVTAPNRANYMMQ